MANIKCAGILTGGGDCPGLNAVIRAVTKSLITQYGIKVIGIEDGFQGLIENRCRELAYDDVSGILQVGGTILGTSNKADPFHHPVTENGKTVYKDLSDLTIANAKTLGMDVLVCIGGDGTMTIANQLIGKGLPIVGVPKTIDNDLYGTDVTFGYDTAVSIAAEAIDRIHTTASSHHRIMLVEIMGRYAGWLTLGAGIAGGADIIIIPEIEYDIDAICDVVTKRSKKGRRFSIVAVAEGAKARGGDMTVSRVIKDSPDQLRLGGVSVKLANEIEDRTGLETRTTILGHLQRGGSPTANDRILSSRYGVGAANLIGSGQLNRMVALQGGKITSVPIAEIGGRTRKVTIDDELVNVAKEVGTSLGIY